MNAPGTDAVRLSEALALIDTARDGLAGLARLLSSHDPREDTPEAHQLAALIAGAAAPLDQVMDLFGAGACRDGPERRPG